MVHENLPACYLCQLWEPKAAAGTKGTPGTRPAPFRLALWQEGLHLAPSRGSGGEGEGAPRGRTAAGGLRGAARSPAYLWGRPRRARGRCVAPCPPSPRCSACWCPTAPAAPGAGQTPRRRDGPGRCPPRWSGTPAPPRSSPWAAPATWQRPARTPTALGRWPRTAPAGCSCWRPLAPGPAALTPAHSGGHGAERSLPSPGSAPGAAVLAGTARYRWSSRCRGCPAPPAAARDAPCSVPLPTLNEGAQAKRSPSAPSPHARGPAVGSEHLAHSAPYIGRAGRRGPSSRAPQPSPGPAPHSRDPHPRRGPSSPRSPAPPPGEGPAAAPGSGAPTAASPSRAARPDSGPSRARPPTTCPSVHRPAPCSATLRQRLERRAAGPPEEGGGRSAAAGGENGFCANTRFYRCYRRWWMLFTFPVIVLMRPGGYKV